MSERLNVDEFLAGYLAEVEEHLSSANTQLVALDQSLRSGESNPRAVRELFRSLHTIKGLSAMVGANPIVDIAHEMESLLRAVDRGVGRLPDAALDLLLRGARAIEDRVGSLARSEPLKPAPPELVEALRNLPLNDPQQARGAALSLEPELLAKLSAAEQEQLLLALAKGRRALRVDFAPSAERAAQGLSITRVRASISRLGELVKVVPRSRPADEGGSGIAFALILVTDASDEQVAEAAYAEPADVESIGAATSSEPEPESLDSVGEQHRDNQVRVDVGRLDDALERLAALVVSRARLQRAVHGLAQGEVKVDEVVRLVAEGGRELRDLRSAILRARMVPVAGLLQRAPLIVRGLCKNGDKEVRLQIDAGNAEVDKAVADRMAPVLVHLLRNAVDHGIEPPDERAAAGKPREGTVRITCVELPGNRLELSISDDGRGIDPDRVAARAGSPVPRDEAELLELICRAGLSTFERATQTSGRGLGMDIVWRTAVNDLGGELRLFTEPQVGTTFTLRLPLSIAILDAFTLQCGGETFVVPVRTVDTLTEIDASCITEPPGPRRRGPGPRLLSHRGVTMPLFSLRQLLGVAADPVEAPKAVIVRHQDELIAFEVDRMLGQHEVVVRPTVDPLVKVAGVAGSTDLGDGRPTLVLDLPGLIRQRAATMETA